MARAGILMLDITRVFPYTIAEHCNRKLQKSLVKEIH